ncbi:GlyGly-CTERM sorting domain-containing protein [Bacteroides oleiciplenus]|uniref:GlyGly-CTERM sorting domain-containing protein n=1 Tax=Bacteroides oleiciplenus TaxID=626931 RepID=A0A3E5BIK2_9BACE|nr:GlyGly-CTERM sorting domain-containing protein [Bacteroides oleiciplenus]
MSFVGCFKFAGGEVPRGSSLSFFSLLIILFLSFARKKKYQKEKSRQKKSTSS